ncbi:hypothetical protein OSB04_005630, partial [Centaurea solstitialis]
MKAFDKNKEVSRRGIAWFKWDKVLESFKRGGLNVGSIKDLNRGLIGKWWWIFHTEPESLWRAVIVSIYGRDGGLSGRGSWGLGPVWSSLIKCGRESGELGFSFLDSFGIELGNGNDISFWEDRWLPIGRLKESFGRLYALETNKGVKVGDRGEFRNGAWCWRWDWRRDPRGRELGELNSLCGELKGVAPRMGERDRVRWFLDPQVGFSVKKLRNLIEESRSPGGNNLVLETEWPKSVPKKVNIFVWRLRLGRIPTRSVLDKMGIDLDSFLCPRCGEQIEDLEHALFKCEKVKPLWELVSVTPKNLKSLFIAKVTNRTAAWELFERLTKMDFGGLEPRVPHLVGQKQVCVSKRKASIVENFTEFQLKIFEWITRRDPELKMEMAVWLNDPFD